MATDGNNPGGVAAIAAAVAILAQGIGPLVRVLAGSRLALRKATLREVSIKQDELDSSYVRLERENERLHAEVIDLREDLEREREARRETDRELDRIRERCDDCERYMRMLGKKLPPTE